MPMGMMHRAVEGFGERVRMLIRPGGWTFQHRQKEEAEGDALRYPIIGDPQDIIEEQQKGDERSCSGVGGGEVYSCKINAYCGR